MFAIGMFLATVLFLHLLKKIQCILFLLFVFKMKTTHLNLWIFINFFVLETLPFSLHKQA